MGFRRGFTSELKINRHQIHSRMYTGHLDPGMFKNKETSWKSFWNFSWQAFLLFHIPRTWLSLNSNKGSLRSTNKQHSFGVLFSRRRLSRDHNELISCRWTLFKWWNCSLNQTNDISQDHPQLWLLGRLRTWRCWWSIWFSQVPAWYKQHQTAFMVVDENGGRTCVNETDEFGFLRCQANVS